MAAPSHFSWCVLTLKASVSPSSIKLLMTFKDQTGTCKNTPCFFSSLNSPTLTTYCLRISHDAQHISDLISSLICTSPILATLLGMKCEHSISEASEPPTHVTGLSLLFSFPFLTTTEQKAHIHAEASTTSLRSLF